MSQSQTPGTIYSTVEEDGGTEFSLEGQSELSTELVADFDTAESWQAAAAGPESASAEASAAEGQRCEKIKLFKIRNWPEFKVEMKKQCRKVFGRRVCINVPQGFQRSCELTAYAEVCHPDIATLRGAFVDCAKQAVVAGAVAGIYTGNAAAATAALKAYMLTCLRAKAVQNLDRLTVKVTADTSCGDWRPR